MDITGIEKININNAIVVFLLLINCLLFPLTILMEINYKYFFEFDLIKIIGATLCVGCTNFAIVYSFTALLSVNSKIPIQPSSYNFLFQRPLVLTTISLTTINLIVLFVVEKNDINYSLRNLAYGDFATFLGQLGFVIEAKVKLNRALKKSQKEH